MRAVIVGFRKDTGETSGPNWMRRVWLASQVSETHSSRDSLSGGWRWCSDPNDKANKTQFFNSQGDALPAGPVQAVLSFEHDSDFDHR